MSPRQRWDVGLSPWIVQDGNYDDFAVSQRREFALEFYAENGLAPSSATAPSAEAYGQGRYRIAGRVIHREPHWWAIDVGVRCFQEAPPPETAMPGQFLEGEIYLGIDPFFYFESLSKEAGAPDLTYDWHIDSITRESAPLLRTPNAWIPDESRMTAQSVGKTNA